MAEINYKTEKCWLIEDKEPIKLRVAKHWSGGHYTVKCDAMLMSYELWQSLDSHGKVDISGYDYSNGECSFSSYTIESIKEWERENKDKIVIEYNK